jgi:hypothetical protein
MRTSYFSDCKNLADVKRRYKELAMLHHPDKGGNTATMQEINAEYKAIIHNPSFSFAETTEEEKQDFIKYPDIIDKIIALQGILIEIIGDWIWLSGNTYPYRQFLKETGFFFAPKKVMWYYRPSDYKSSNTKPKTIESIRSKYGSDVIENKSFILSIR